jgi:hypothetical protein
MFSGPSQWLLCPHCNYLVCARATAQDHATGAVSSKLDVVGIAKRQDVNTESTQPLDLTVWHTALVKQPRGFLQLGSARDPEAQVV